MTMALSQDTVLCGICNEPEVIEKWCPECDARLCAGCEKHHRISESSRHHAVISIDGLPAEISHNLNDCDVHKMEFKFYCTQHDMACCPHCIPDHKTCRRLVAIEDVVKNVKTSSWIEDIDQSLQDCTMNLEKIINDREQNLSKINEQRNQVQAKIKQTRDQINTQLDNLEREFLKKLDASEKSLKSQIEQLLGQLKEKYRVVNQLQHNITAIKSHASNIQVFLGSKHLEKQVYQEERYITSLYIDGSLKTTELNCTINEKIAEIPAISTFGSITIENTPQSVVVSMRKQTQAQIMISEVEMHPSGSIDDIKLTLIRTFYLPKGNGVIRVTGCSFFHDGRIAFADCDNNKRIVITNDLGMLQNEISVFPACPFDVTCLDSNSLAVTSDSDNKTRIINTTSKITTNTIATTGLCHGITNRQGTLIYCERRKGIIGYQLDNKSSKTFVRQNIPNWTYVASNENFIYQTNTAFHTVTCYNLTGDKKWTFQDTSILRRPRGVAVDKHSNVYVASDGNKSIVVISSDGKKSRQILESRDGIKYPWALAVHQQSKRLLVTDIDGEILLYNLS